MTAAPIHQDNTFHAGGVIQFPTSRGQVAIIDECDDYVLQHKWSASPILRKSGGFYAVRRVRGSNTSLHRMIMGAKPGQLVDHINGNGLDNRRSNLRLCTLSENAVNRVYANSTGYRGVSRSKNSTTLWKAQLTAKGRVYWINALPSPEAAALAYDKLAREHFGEFAILNFPDAEAAA